jgi:acyl transferase domain-containing protein/acyl carrier protein
MTVLIMDATGGAAMAGQVGSRSVIEVRHEPGATAARHSGDTFWLDGTDSGQLAVAVDRAATAAGDGRLDVVVTLAATLAIPTEPHAERTGQLVRDVLLPLLSLARLLGPRWLTRTADSLHVLTRGVGPGGVAGVAGMVGAPAAAFVLALRYEFPALAVRVTDLVRADHASVTAALARTDTVGLAALREGTLLEQVIEDADDAAAAIAAAPPRTAAAPRAVVITGGLGGVGQALVGQLLRLDPQVPVALLHRRAPTATDPVRPWTGPGRVAHYRADVTDRHSLRSALHAVREDLGPIGHVVHAAGVLRDGLAVTSSGADLAAVLAPKVTGSLLLDELTATDELDSFVLVASTAGLYGARGQAGYAAANAFLDAFAAWRGTCRAGRSLALDYSVWAGTGMAAALPAGGPADRAEVVPLAADGAAHVLAAAALARPGEPGATRLVVERRRNPARRRPLLAPAMPARPTATIRADAAGDLAVRARRVIGAALAPFGIDVDDDQLDFFSLGLDSGRLLQLAERLGHMLGVDLYVTLLFEYATPRALADHLADQHGAALLAVSTTEPAADIPAAPAAAATADLPGGLGNTNGAIAVVGYAYQLPGGEAPGQYWDTMITGRSVFASAPDWRRRRGGAGSGRVAALLDDPTGFDPLLFRIAPKDAAITDPQHRLALECCWAALEHAGEGGLCTPRGPGPPGTRAGVYLGVMNSEYESEAIRAGVELRAGTGTSRALLANAVSHAFDLTGPSMTVETACSSSLAAVHLGIQALRGREADLVLAGGVNVLAAPALYDRYAEAGLLSPTGRCRPFDAAADGYVRGEGVGVVVLKRLADAVADRNVIHAVIRGSAVGHNGRGSGLGAPDPAAQAEVITRALADAHLRAADIDYVEAHGTGTSLGDPVEMQGIAAAFGPAAPDCQVGSVKGNIGHLESAAGIASLLKVVLCLQHEIIPPTAGLTVPNPLLQQSQRPVPRLVRQPTAWPRGERPRRAGVSAFGFGGTNAHVVVEEPPRQARPAGHDAAPAGPALVLVSARTGAALDAACGSLADHVEARPDVRLTDIAFTRASGRAHLDRRRAVVAVDHAALIRALRDPARTPPTGNGRPAGPLLWLGGRLPAPPAVDIPAIRDEMARFRDVLAAESGPRRVDVEAVAGACAVLRWLRGWYPGLRLAGVGAGAVALAVHEGDLVPGGIADALAGASGAWPTDAGSADAGDLLWSHVPGPDPWERLLRQLGDLYEQGLDARWDAVAPSGDRVALPPYPFERTRYWCFDDLGSDDPGPEDHVGPGMGDSHRPGLHVTTWLELDPAGAPAADGAGRLLVILDGGAATRQRATDAGLPARDTPVLHLDSADADACRAGLADLLERVTGAAVGGEAGRDVLVLVDAPGAHDLAASDRTATSCAALAAFAEALLPHRGRVGLTVVTGTGTDAGGTRPDPVTAAVLSFAHVLQQEEPGLLVRLVDVDPTTDPAIDLDRILAAPVGGVFAIRGGRLLRQDITLAPPVGVDNHEPVQAWWVTGGTGAIGAALARSLAADGTPVVVTSRTPPAPGVLGGDDLDITWMRADLTSETDVVRVAATIRERYGPGYGVVHLAGIAGCGRRARTVTSADLAAVLTAKVGGARLLERHTAEDQVRRFVAVSSAAVTLGGLGTADYAAANAALDALVRRRRAHGWHGAVVAPAAVSGTRLGDLVAARGVPVVDLAAVVAAVHRAIDDDQPHLMVLGESGTGDRLRVLSPRRASRSATGPLPAPAGDGDPPARFWSLLAKTLGCELDEIAGSPATFADLGMDSRAQLAFVAELEDELGLELPVDALSPDASVADISALVDRLAGRGDTAC